MEEALNPIRNSILKTLAYRNVFSYPLTFHQLYTYVISESGFSFEEFKEALRNLLTEKIIFYEDGFFHLGSAVIEDRKRREEDSRKLLLKAQKISRILGANPFVKLIAVTGAVAAGNAVENDDIEVMVITTKDRLWLGRFFTVLMLKALNLYRTDKDAGGKICPNIFIDEENLEWGYAKNVYIAHEILLMQPVFDRGGYYFRFLNANRWSFEFLPHVKVKAKDEEFKSPERFFNFLITFEYLLMKLQLWYMQKRITNEITTDRLIHFRRDDHSSWILTSYEEGLKRLGVD